MRPPLLVLALGLGLAPGCAMNDKDLCPESKGIRCATAPDCTRDSARGCRVCQCGSPYSTAPYNPARAPSDPARGTDPTQAPH